MAPSPKRVELASAIASSSDATGTIGATDEGVLAQRDTYFGRARGRLKLREQEGGHESGARLIAYVRPDGEQARTSNYRLAEVDDPAALADALDAALGTLVVVDKRRRLLLYENVRIHIDDVAGLGSFVELEGVAQADSDLSREYELVARLREETFGPVAPIVPVASLDEAIALANSTRFGLGANVDTRDLETVVRCMREIKAGTVWFNDPLTDNDAGPFGGYKQSGLGRELGQEGLEAFQETKHVHIETKIAPKEWWYPYGAGA